VENRTLASTGPQEAEATTLALERARRFRERATATFARQVIVLAILVIANAAAKRSIQRQRRRLAASRKNLRAD